MLTFDLLASKVKFASLFVWARKYRSDFHSGERIVARGPLVFLLKTALVSVLISIRFAPKCLFFTAEYFMHKMHLMSFSL